MFEKTANRLTRLSRKSLKPTSHFRSAVSDPGEPTQTDLIIDDGSSFDTSNDLNHHDMLSGPFIPTQAAPMLPGMPYVSYNTEQQWLDVPAQQRHVQHGSDRRRQRSDEYPYTASPHRTSTSGAMDISSAVSSATGPEDEAMDGMMMYDPFSIPETNNAIKQTSHEELPDLFYGFDPITYASYSLNCSRSYADFYSFIRNSLKKHKSRGNMARENISDDKYKRAIEIKTSITGRSMTLNNKHKEHYKLVRQVLFGTSLDTPILECHNKGKHDICRARRSESEKKGKHKATSSTEHRGISTSNTLFGDNGSNFHTNSTVSTGSQFHGVPQQVHLQFPLQHQAYPTNFSSTPLEGLDHSTLGQDGGPFTASSLGGGNGGCTNFIRDIDRCVNRLNGFRSLALQGYYPSASLQMDVSKFAASIDASQQSIGCDRAFLPSSSTQQTFHRLANPPPVQERMLAAGPRRSIPMTRHSPSNLPLTPDGSSGSNRNRSHWPHRPAHGRR